MVGTKSKYAAAIVAIAQALGGAPSVTAKIVGNSDPDSKERVWKTGRDGTVGGLRASGRIVGGQMVPNSTVYPFYANWDGRCGASLIHPDILLTAGHCNELMSTSVTIGAYELDNPNTAGAVTRTIVERAVHPQFDSFTLEYDYAVLLLDSPVMTIDPIKINYNENIPTPGQDLTVIGLGSLSEGGSSPQFLQEVIVPTISDAQCKIDYTDFPFVEEIMFCAGSDDGLFDSCQGDSGGPIFSVTESGDVDKQVGIVSWGLGCARPGKPGVYAEISVMADWIFAKICQLSSDRPIDCPPLTAAPTPVPPGEGEAAVDVNIFTDRFPQENSWTITDDSNNIVASVEVGSIVATETLVTTTVNLEKGKSHTFTIFDSYGDGLCCTYGNGNYSVETGDLILASGSQFGRSEATTFIIPEDSAPSPPGPTSSPGIDEIELRVEIFTDNFPREVSWHLHDVFTGIEVASTPLGSYTVPGVLNSTTVVLEPEKFYNFTIFDKAGDGLCCEHGDGNYSLVVDGMVLASGGEYTDSESTVFMAPSISTPEPTPAPTSEPTLAPSPAPTLEPTARPSENEIDEGIVLVEVNIFTDRYPFETSWSIFDSNDVLLFEAPLGDYFLSFEYHTSPVYLEVGAEYTFQINDVYGDGICCANGPGNYSVTTGNFVLASGGSFGFNESTTFVVPEGSGPSLPDNDNEIVLTVGIFTDEYPREIAWWLHDTSGNEVASSPLGSLIAQGQLISTEVILVSGVEYNFTIFDKGGDGLCCGYGIGNYSLSAGNMAIASGAEYGELETTIFIAPAYSETVDCMDTNGVFVVDSVQDIQGCNWLANNMEDYPWLCKFVDVAVTCPLTCDICEYLSNPSFS